MKRKIPIILAVIAMMFFLCTGLAAQEKAGSKDGAVEITFNRPVAIGDTYSMKTHVDFHSMQSRGFGMQASKMIKDVKGDLSAKIRVLKVNKTGQSTMLFCTVAKANMVDNGKKVDLGIDGVQLGVSFPKSGVHFVRRDGKEVSKEAQFFLSQIMQPPDGINPDDYLSAKRPVHPGESWNADSKVLAKLFTDGQISIKPSDIHATVTFVGMERWNDTDCYHVVFKGSAENLKRPYVMGTMKIEQEEDLLIPVDAKSRVYRSMSTFKSDFVGKYMAENQPLIPVKSETTVKIETAVR